MTPYDVTRPRWINTCWHTHAIVSHDFHFVWRIQVVFWKQQISDVQPSLFSSWILSSLAPGGFQFNFRKVIFKLTLVNGSWGIPYEIALRWMPPDLTDDQSTLVQVMAWCRQAPSHYLSQCWPRSLSPYGITRPQWVNSFPRELYSPSRIDSFVGNGSPGIKPLSINATRAWVITCRGNNKYILYYPIQCLTHPGLLTPYGDRDLGQHWLR